MRFVLPLLGLALATAPLKSHIVEGVVHTSDGVPIVGAEVWLVDTKVPGDSAIAATSGVDGTYRFTLPMSATSGLLVRRRGFHDARARLAVDPNAPTKRPVEAPAVSLEPVVPPLATVVVREGGDFFGPGATFYRHMLARRGQFLTRYDIARLNPLRTSMLLRMLPGVSVQSTANGSSVRLRGQTCESAVYLDGLSIGGRMFDVDMVTPEMLLGVEIYSQPSMVPAEYTSQQAISCGVLAFWTKRGAESSGGSFDPVSVVDPASLHLPTDVDEPVRLVGATAFEPHYPAEARALGIGGAVTVELIVDTTGAVERSSAGVVSTLLPVLGDAAVDATEKLKFTPAKKAGHPVRQLVHLVAVFQPDHPAEKKH